MRHVLGTDPGEGMPGWLEADPLLGLMPVPFGSGPGGGGLQPLILPSLGHFPSGRRGSAFHLVFLVLCLNLPAS